MRPLGDDAPFKEVYQHLLPSQPQANGASPAWRKFFYPYNAFIEAEKALKYRDEPDEMPAEYINHFFKADDGN